MKRIDDLLDEYIENKAFQEIFADALMITNEKGIVRYAIQYRQDVNIFPVNEIIGMHILEVYPSIRPEDSTLLRALRGVPTISELTTQTTYNGRSCSLLENTFPIKRNGGIIGAISFAKYANYFKQELTIPDSSVGKVNRMFMTPDIIGSSPQVRRLRSQINQIAKTNSAVLICGETGTGKEMVAQSTHSGSIKNRKTFLSQNCAAIPGNLMESLLFGTTKGSYTGATDRPGIFEIANGGTVFLDEINSMDVNMQAKILKVLEEKRVTRIGSGQSIPVDVRILAAMNEDPQECIAAGHLRSDLFYRLSTVIITIPALRERREDILPLLEHFVDFYNSEMGKEIEGLEPEVEQLFLGYDWPGNVRELRNAIEGAFNFEQEKRIQKQHLPTYFLKAMGEEIHSEFVASPFLQVLGIKPIQKHIDGLEENESLTAAVEHFEKQMIMKELKESKNLVALAKKLGISRQSLRYKLKKYNLTVSSSHDSPLL